MSTALSDPFFWLLVALHVVMGIGLWWTFVYQAPQWVGRYLNFIGYQSGKDEDGSEHND